jgi:hypothetical protein
MERLGQRLPGARIDTLQGRLAGSAANAANKLLACV